MDELPKEPGQIRERIRRYQRKLRAEKSRSGRIHDGAGKRYLLGPLFLLLGDLNNALNCYRWFEAEFPEDGGELGHHLCWALALYHGGDQEAAARKLRQTMLLNLVWSNCQKTRLAGHTNWKPCRLSSLAFLADSSDRSKPSKEHSDPLSQKRTFCHSSQSKTTREQ